MPRRLYWGNKPINNNSAPSGFFKHLRIFQVAQRVGYAERTISNLKNEMLKEFAIRFFAVQARLGIEDKDIIDLTKKLKK